MNLMCIQMSQVYLSLVTNTQDDENEDCLSSYFCTLSAVRHLETVMPKLYCYVVIYFLYHYTGFYLNIIIHACRVMPLTAAFSWMNKGYQAYICKMWLALSIELIL